MSVRVRVRVYSYVSVFALADCLIVCLYDMTTFGAWLAIRLVVNGRRQGKKDKNKKVGPYCDIGCVWSDQGSWGMEGSRGTKEGSIGVWLAVG